MFDRYKIKPIRKKERKLIKLLNECSLISLNGRKVGDTYGKLTCHQYNGSSTVDLHIVSWDLYEKVQFF